MNFFIPCIPPTATSQQKGAFARPGGGVRFFKKARVARAERDLVSLLSAYCPNRERIDSGPVRVDVAFVWPYRKSEAKKRIGCANMLAMDVRPDVDNLVKMLLDAMTRCAFWSDDGQVSDLSITKYWGPKPGIYITVERIA